jgi:hypothetical protein
MVILDIQIIDPLLLMWGVEKGRSGMETCSSYQNLRPNVLRKMSVKLGC